MTLTSASITDALVHSLVNMPVIAIVLFAAGFILVGIEMFMPGFGAAGGCGLVCLFLGIVFTARSVAEGLVLSLILIGGVGIILSILLFSASRGRLSHKLILRSETRSEEGYVAVPSYSEYLGKIGTALTDLHPSGIVLIDGKRLDVITEGGYLRSGSRVEILRVEGSRVIVRRVPEAQSKN